MKKLKQAMAGQSSLLVNSKFGASIKVLKKDGHRAQLTFLTAIFKLGVLYFFLWFLVVKSTPKPM